MADKKQKITFSDWLLVIGWCVFLGAIVCKIKQIILPTNFGQWLFLAAIALAAIHCAVNLDRFKNDKPGLIAPFLLAALSLGGMLLHG
ncbi:hypothetical protein [Burkholderia vietnamiensis]|uniref:hypothetical protein n=1 Tax=Burkholderia vietnamiensis TaxID=60552 RepID=UPI001592ECF5|nr:hypothetical protein [Burkholderia vietnamiensis]MCA8073732.1 hypothetical protein [Burkholderia vietnamiensis]